MRRIGNKLFSDANTEVVIQLPPEPPKPPKTAAPLVFDKNTNTGRVMAGIRRSQRVGPLDVFFQAVYDMAEEVDQLRAEDAALKAGK